MPPPEQNIEIGYNSSIASWNIMPASCFGCSSPACQLKSCRIHLPSGEDDQPPKAMFSGCLDTVWLSASITAMSEASERRQSLSSSFSQSNYNCLLSFSCPSDRRMSHQVHIGRESGERGSTVVPSATCFPFSWCLYAASVNVKPGIAEAPFVWSKLINDERDEMVVKMITQCRIYL